MIYITIYLIWAIILFQFNFSSQIKIKLKNNMVPLVVVINKLIWLKLYGLFKTLNFKYNILGRITSDPYI